MKISRSKLILIILIGIFILSLVIRFVYLYQLKTSPLFGFFAADSATYDKFALEILDGNFIYKDSVFLHPLYPFFLSLIYFVFGHSLIAVAVCQIILDSLICIFLYLICVKIFNRKSVGLLASFIYASYGLAFFYTVFLLDTTLVVFLNVALILVLLYSKAKENLTLWFFSGIILGLIILLKANIILFLPFLLIWLFYSPDGKVKVRKKILNVALIFAGVIIILSPFSIRNYIIEKNFSPLPAHGGINFYIGNNPDANGSYVTLFGMPNSPVEYTRNFILKARKETGEDLTSSQASNYWLFKGLEFIRDNKVQYLSLSLKKLSLFWNSQEILSNLSYYFSQKFLPILNFPFFSFGVIAPLSILGFIFAIKEKSRYLYLIVLLIFSQMIYLILFFVTSRYRLPVVPFMIILGSYAVYNLGLLIKSSEFKKLACYFVLFLILFIPMNKQIEEFNPKNSLPAAYNNLGIVYNDKGMFKEAIAEYQEAIKLDPNYALAYYNLGIAYKNVGNHREAITSYKKALEIFPFFTAAYNNLGFDYMTIGMPEKAIVSYKKTLEIDPNYAQAHYNLAVAYYNKKEYALAIQHCDRARELGITDEAFLNVLKPYRR